MGPFFDARPIHTEALRDVERDRSALDSFKARWHPCDSSPAKFSVILITFISGRLTLARLCAYHIPQSGRGPLAVSPCHFQLYDHSWASHDEKWVRCKRATKSP